MEKNKSINYRLSIGVFLLSFLLQSCTKIKCEAFDLTHQVVDWHLFPDSFSCYEFSGGDSLIITLEQSNYSLDGYEERWCHMCACLTDYNVTYMDSEELIHIQCIAHYNSLNGISPGSLYYGINDISINLHLTDDGATFRSDLIYDDDSFGFEILDSIVLNDKTFHDIAEISILENHEIEKFWVAKGKGLVGLDYNNMTLIIKE